VHPLALGDLAGLGRIAEDDEKGGRPAR
jgi:hypothetical protein